MREKQKLKFVFHNPNTEAATEKFLTEWFAKVSVPVIEKLIQDNSSEEGGGQDEQDNVNGVENKKEKQKK